MNDKKGVRAAKYAAYALVMTLLYVLQTTPAFLEIFGVKPNLVIPAAVCVAMLEGEFAGGFYGVLAGVFCDVSGPAIFGFNAVLLLVACVAVGLAFLYLLRPCMINFVLLTFGALLARGLTDYLLNYYMWGYDNVWMVLTYQILPGILYSAAVSPLVYYLYTWMGKKFQERLED